MAHESFEDKAVAAVLNERFVSIKVDREERPDIDQIYMNVCHAMTGQGGWPLTIVMTPTKIPYFAGTYIPRTANYGRPGILETLDALYDAWENDRQRVERIGHQVVISFSRALLPKADREPDKEIFFQAAEEFSAQFDARYGGFGSAPKFPSAHNLLFLLRHAALYGDRRALEMVEKTLRGMHAGGIWDHLGFGFARYSTDEKWLIPHFEKMLYDNALLVHAYLDAYQMTREPFFARIAEETLTYIRRSLFHHEGAFCSAEDADSDGEEGRFYVFTKSEIEGILTSTESTAFCRRYGVTEEGNFNGSNVLNLLSRDPDDGKSVPGLSEEQFELLVEGARRKVFFARERHPKPSRDDKVLTGWNALAIGAMAKGARILGGELWLKAAEEAYRFIETRLVREDGRLLARYRDGESKHLACLDDYAFLAWASLELYETTLNPDYLERAVEWTRRMKSLFWDDGEGGFFFSGHDAERLFARPKELSDGALPSGNSAAALVLARLAAISGDREWIELRDRQIRVMYGSAHKYPTAFSFFLTALQWVLAPTAEIVLAAGDPADETLAGMISAVRERFLPNAVVLVRTDETAEKLASIAPFTRGQGPVQGGATAYVCENYACRRPVSDADGLVALLEAAVMKDRG